MSTTAELLHRLEIRDPYTAGHSMRVAAMARKVAEAMGLPEDTQDRVETAALVHDIGKADEIFMPILSKPGPLTGAERTIIEQSPERGVQMLQEVGGFSPEVLAAVRHHRERFDGTGYPGRLRAETIPLEARIIAVCDALDSMLSDTLYRDLLSVAEARRELTDNSGTQFDPAVVRALLDSGALYRDTESESSEEE